jgi:hypothetical protein
MPIATALNFSSTTPPAPTGKQLIVPQNDAGAPTCNESFYDPMMVGDTGTGGLAGNVPAPAAGDAAAGKLLGAGGSFIAFTEEVVTFSGTAGTLGHAPRGIVNLYRNGIRMTTLAGSPAISTYSKTGAALTLSIAAGGSDVLIAVYL